MENSLEMVIFHSYVTVYQAGYPSHFGTLGIFEIRPPLARTAANSPPAEPQETTQEGFYMVLPFMLDLIGNY
jgi:hypothetical protein